MPDADKTTMAAQNADLRRMRKIATGVLVGISGTFIGTYFVDQPGQTILLIRAMAEAGMVGGLADWFAVEALFRRPLGLPIPHTAPLPANQHRAAENVGDFFDSYFMEPDALRRKLTEVQPVTRLSEWLSDRDNAHFIARQISFIMAALFKSGFDRELAEKSGTFFKPALLDATNSRELSNTIGDILQSSLHGDLLDALLNQVTVAIDQNRPKVLELVQERSRWWIASNIDKRMAGLLVDGVLSVVEDLTRKDGELRTEFETAIDGLIKSLQKSGTLTKHIDKGMKAFLATDTFDTLMSKLVEDVRDHLAEDLEKNPESMATALAEPIQHFAIHLTKNKAMQTEFTDRLSDAFEYVLARLRPVLKTHITQTISGWDSADLVDRFENAVGRDLQFIRINGSILGAFIGGCLFFLGKLLA